MEDSSQQQDPGAFTAVSFQGEEQGSYGHDAGRKPAGEDPSHSDTDPLDAFFSAVEQVLPRDYRLFRDEAVIRKCTGDDLIDVSQPFFIRHMEVARTGRPAQLFVAMCVASGVIADVKIPADDIGKGAPKGVAMLRGAGLRIFTTDARFAELLRAMHYVTLDPPALKPGWVSQAPPVYCLADGSVIADKADAVMLNRLQPSAEMDAALLERWTKEIAARLTGNPLALFVICQQFAGPLLQLVGADSAVFNLAVRTSQGKSFLLELAQRMWPSQTIQSWAATRASLDDACLLANDGPLILDELPMARAGKLSPAIFVITNGIRRSSRPAPGETPESRRWLTSAIATSERPFWDTVISEARKGQGPKPVSELVFPVPEGTFVRLVDIGGVDERVWRETHGHADIARLLTALDRSSKDTLGIAGPAFVRQLLAVVRKKPVELRQVFEERTRRLAREIGVDQGAGISAETRVMRHFAVVMLAGELAVRFKLLPQTYEEVRSAVTDVARSWARIRGVGKHTVEENPVAMIRTWVWPRLGKDMREVDSDRRPVDRKPWGAKGWFNDEYYFFLRETLQPFVPAGASFKTLRDILEASGALEADNLSPSKQVRMSSRIGPDIRVYQLRRDVIDRRVDLDDED